MIYRASATSPPSVSCGDAGCGQSRAARAWLLTGEMPEPDLLGMLHHVALGTVADVAPLIGLNRAFVAKG